MKERLRKIKKINNESGRDGVAIYFAMAALSIVLAIALSISLLFTRRMQMLNRAGDAVVAFSAAHTGIERVLYEMYVNNANITSGYDSGEINLGNDAIYHLTAQDCGVGELCVKSVGEYRGARRAIRIRM